MFKYFSNMLCIALLTLTMACSQDAPSTEQEISNLVPPGPGDNDDPTDPDDPDNPEPLGDECLQLGTDWIFCSGFEEGDLSTWDDWDGNPPETNLLMADPGPFDQADNHVMRFRLPPGRGTADLVKVLPDSYDRLYARWYVKWEEGYDFSAPCHGGGLHAGSREFLGHSGDRPTGADWFSSWIEPLSDNQRLELYTYYRGMEMDCVDPDGSCWGDHFPCMGNIETYCSNPDYRPTNWPPLLETGRWYCVEMLLDGGTPVFDRTLADGIQNLWLDGEEFGPWTDLWFRTTSDLKIGILWLSLFHHGEHSVEGMMIDNVVVSTSRIGCVGDS